jgi:hypothetical protein
MDTAQAPETPQLTLAERRAGVSFNPSNIATVDVIKKKTAELLQVYQNIQSDSEDGEVKRMAAVAITELQTSQMWGVKATTWNAN